MSDGARVPPGTYIGVKYKYVDRPTVLDRVDWDQQNMAPIVNRNGRRADEMSKDNDVRKCGWCKQWWHGKAHECTARSTLTLPCYRCGANVPTKPSGYGLSVDFLHEAYVRHLGYGRNEVTCSEACTAAVKADEDRKLVEAP